MRPITVFRTTLAVTMLALISIPTLAKEQTPPKEETASPKLVESEVLKNELQQLLRGMLQQAGDAGEPVNLSAEDLTTGMISESRKVMPTFLRAPRCGTSLERG